MAGFDPLSAIIGLVKDGVDKIFPDPADKLKAEALKADLEKAILAQGGQLMQAQASIITAEANSQSWIARNWRPISALTFLFLIVAHWFGLDAKNLTEAQYLSLFDLEKICLGGYIASRGLEKIADSVGDSFGTTGKTDSKT